MNNASPNPHGKINCKPSVALRTNEFRLLDLCSPSNWEAFSYTSDETQVSCRPHEDHFGDVPDGKIKTRPYVIRKIDPKFVVLKYPPQCDICPGKDFRRSLFNFKSSSQTVLKVQVCGEPNFSGKSRARSSLVDFNFICNLVNENCEVLHNKAHKVLGKARNKIFYYVSPSIYNDPEFMKSFTNMDKSKSSREHDSEQKDSTVEIYASNRENVNSFYNIVGHLPSSEDVKSYTNSTSSRRHGLPSSCEFPPTPTPSVLIGSDHNTSPVCKLPKDPENIVVDDKMAVKQYLSTVKTSKNESEVAALLESVYDIEPVNASASKTQVETSEKDNSGESTSKTKTKKPMELMRNQGVTNNKDEDVNETGFQNGRVQEMTTTEENEKSGQPHKDNCDLSNCEHRGHEMTTEEDDEKQKGKSDRPRTDECSLTNCEQLGSYQRHWKTCCGKNICPINDPTTSTYNFLLRVRMCCRTRGCQLAAKICDIYESLVDYETDLNDVGDEKYHYLSSDVSTSMDTPEEALPSIAPASELPVNYDTVTEFDMTASIADQPYDDADMVLSQLEEVSTVMVSPSPSQERRRTSTVSWVDGDARTASQEEIESKATKEAEKFRQTGGHLSLKQSLVLGEAVHKSTIIADRPHFTSVTSAEVQKSKINNISSDSSQHIQRCCPLLKSKFKKKKKKSPLLSEERSVWLTTNEYEKRQNLEPVPEKDKQIKHVLHKM